MMLILVRMNNKKIIGKEDLLSRTRSTETKEPGDPVDMDKQHPNHHSCGIIKTTPSNLHASLYILKLSQHRQT